MEKEAGFAPVIPLLMAAPLFAGFSAGELATLLPLLAPARRRYAKGEVVLMAGDTPTEMGLVLSGVAEAVKYTRAGAQFLVARHGPGRVFGDVLAVGTAKSPVTVSAAADLEVLMIPGQRLYAPPGAQAELFRRLLVNLAAVLSDKYFALDRRVDLLLMHGLRKRLAAFLLDAAEAAGAAEGAPFAIPYTRAQLAAYLGCERSALSREISRMAQDGLLKTRRSVFTLPDEARLRALF
ncbi:Crp/Fnr family transcriptional regulator [Ruminococcaceae bacterium OttesenSCG-928-D13]|nr:Crp/Fnr family transcriptional regulator [Ruminococcaceae bacterium OttesenSCG-928-D13]